MKRLTLLPALAVASLVALQACSDDEAAIFTGVEAPTEVGSLRISVHTAGDAIDPDGYTATLDCGCFQALGANATAVMADVEAGAHMVLLTGIADNCELDGTNPLFVDVRADDQTEVEFSLVCTG